MRVYTSEWMENPIIRISTPKMASFYMIYIDLKHAQEVEISDVVAFWGIYYAKNRLLSKKRVFLLWQIAINF